MSDEYDGHGCDVPPYLKSSLIGRGMLTVRESTVRVSGQSESICMLGSGAIAQCEVLVDLLVINGKLTPLNVLTPSPIRRYTGVSSTISERLIHRNE